MNQRPSVLIGLVHLILGAILSCQAQEHVGVASEWKRYELGKGTFTALLPAKPSEEFKPSPPGADVPIDLYLYFVSTPNGVFGAQYAFLGEAAENWAVDATAFYDGVWKGLRESLDEGMVSSKRPERAELIRQRPATFAGHAGRELLFNLGQFKGRVLMTRIRRHAYVAMVMRTEKMELADEDKFLNSFVVKPPAARPEL